LTWVAELIRIPHHAAEEGELRVLEKSQSVPFEPRRAYFISRVPHGAIRGFHAHKRLQQVMVAVAGSLVVTVDDGALRKDFVLNDPSQGLLIREGAWREMSQFSEDAVCLVVASMSYDEADYIRDYDEFVDWRRSF